MSSLHKVLRGALLNNTFDESSLDKSLNKTFSNAFSTLYDAERSVTNHIEKWYKSENRRDEIINDQYMYKAPREYGMMYINNNGYASFDTDIAIIDICDKEKFHRYSFDDDGNIYHGDIKISSSPLDSKNPNMIKKRFHDSEIPSKVISCNKDIFKHIPILSIDGRVVIDYKIMIKDNGCITFILPFKYDFVVDTSKSKKIIVENGEIIDNTYVIVYKDHDIHLFCLENSTILNPIVIAGANLQTTSSKLNVNIPNMRKLCDTSKPGVMFATIKFLTNDTPDLCSALVPMTNVSGTTWKINLESGSFIFNNINTSRLKRTSIYIYPIYFPNLYKYGTLSSFHRDIKNYWDVELAVIQKSEGVLYNAPVPVENLLIFKNNMRNVSDRNNESIRIIKNTDNVELHYPNIYQITDEYVSENTTYDLYYFYRDEFKELKYTNIFEFFYDFIKIYFLNHEYITENNCSFHNIFNLLYKDNNYDIELVDMFETVFSYEVKNHSFGLYDYTKRYLSKPGDVNYRKYPIEYKIDKMKEWVRNQPDVLRDYVKEQNRVSTSYYIYTNEKDLLSRSRVNNSIEAGDISISTNNMEKYDTLLAMENEMNNRIKNIRDFINDVYCFVSETNHYYRIRLYRNEDNRMRWQSIDMGPVCNIDFGNKNYYLFKLHLRDTYPKNMNIRVFVDGIYVHGIHHERIGYKDCIYIPESAIFVDDDISENKQHFIEIEVFKDYTFEKTFKFDSMTSVEEITILEPDKNIFPTMCDMYFVGYDEVDGNTVTNIYDRDMFKVNAVYEEGEYPVSSAPIISQEFVDWDNMMEAFNDPESREIFKDGNIYGTKLDDHFYMFKKYNILERETDTLQQLLLSNLLVDGNYYMEYIKPDENMSDQHVYKYDKKSNSLIDMGFRTRDNVTHDFSGEFVDLGDYLDIEPVVYTRLNKFKITPRNGTIVDKDITLRFSKVPQGTAIIIDQSSIEVLNEETPDKGFVTLGIETHRHYLTGEYVRIFKNGKLLGRNKYIFYAGNNLSIIKIYDECTVGDILYIDITPCKYEEIYYTETIPDDYIIDLTSVINKPFDIEYYDVYLNGRKLNRNNVISISPTTITLVNVKSKYNLQIFEKERDYEYFGLDYSRNIYQFVETDIMKSKILTVDDKKDFINTLIDKRKDEKLIIYPNTNDEEKLDYTNTRAYIDIPEFYYNELLPKKYVNPNSVQFDQDYLKIQYSTIYETFTFKPYDTDGVRRKLYYVDGLKLDPDIVVNDDESKPIYVYSVGHMNGDRTLCFKTTSDDPRGLEVVSDSANLVDKQIRLSDARRMILKDVEDGRVIDKEVVDIGDYINISILTNYTNPETLEEIYSDKDINKHGFPYGTIISINTENDGNIATAPDLYSVSIAGIAIVGIAILGTY